MFEVEQKFNEEMRQIYDKSKELTPPYKPTRFKKMLDQHLYLQPYKQLIQKEDCLEIYQCHKTEWMQQVS